MCFGYHSFKYGEKASFYLDACTILAYLDSDDDRGDKVADIIDYWAEKGSSVCISNHTFTEVCHTRFKRNIIKDIELVERKISKSKKNEEKSDLTKDNEQMIDPSSALFFHSIAKKHKFFQNRNRFYGDVNELVKIVKLHTHGRQKLIQYYKYAVDKFNEFNNMIREIGIEIIFLSSDKEDCIQAQQFMIAYQLDSTDALHLAIAKKNAVDALVTLDSDFDHLNIFNQLPEIIKIA